VNFWISVLWLTDRRLFCLFTQL